MTMAATIPSAHLAIQSSSTTPPEGPVAAAMTVYLAMQGWNWNMSATFPDVLTLSGL